MLPGILLGGFHLIPIAGTQPMGADNNPPIGGYYYFFFTDEETDALRHSR
jgi:hypothetical protein